MNNEYVVRRLVLIGAVAAVLLASLHASLAQQAALAATDTKTPYVQPALSVRQAVEVSAALAQMNCEPKLVRDAMACVPYGTDRLKIAFAWQIAQAQAKVKTVVETYQRERNRMLAAADRKPDGNLTDRAQAKFLSDDADLLDASSGVVLDRFKKAEVEALGLQPGILAALLPIIDER